MEEAQPSTGRGILLASLGVLAFSFSFPATVWALDGFGPWTSTGLRGVIAAAIAVTALRALPAPRPAPHTWGPLSIVALGCALAFPLLTTLALQTSTTAHSAVVIGLLPMTTASLSALRTGTRQPTAFWIAAVIGALAVLAFTLSQNHGTPDPADIYLFGALLLCGAGYAEGGRLSKNLGGWRVIAWGVILAAPINILVAVLGLLHESVSWHLKGIAGLLYIAAVSQFLGFVAWYGGMGIIGVPRASQIQLAQPLLTLAWSVLLMSEHLPVAALFTAIVVLVCIVVTQRASRSASPSQANFHTTITTEPPSTPVETHP